MAADPTKALQSTAHHEAGHAVAAWCRGVPIKALSIQALGGTDGRFEHQPFVGDPGLSPFGLDDFRAQVEDLAVVLYAGPEAQRRFDPDGMRAIHGDGDERMADTLLGLLSSDDEVRAAYANLYRVLARKFVGLPGVWRAIGNLAGDLLDRQRMTGLEVEAVIGEVLGNQPRRCAFD
ncbi:MAG: hypothetical protein KDE22_04775 [Rhodobacterales bacterium]|nr:hypothetical protein [Rhodobacterales bacterium]